MRFIKPAGALLCAVFIVMIETGPAGASNLAWFCDDMGLHGLAELIRLYGNPYIIPFIISLLALIFLILVFLLVIDLITKKTKNNDRPGERSFQYKIKIMHKTDAPYEVSEIGPDQVKSMVKIGIKNMGKAALTECRVQIEKMMPPHPVPFYNKPLVFGEMIRVLRPDDPECLFTIAVYYTESKKYRFATPVGGFMTPYEWIDGSQERTLSIKAYANEAYHSLVFKLFLDHNETLRLQLVGDAA